MSDAKPAYQVLARKYRPETFADLVGQEAMVRTLRNAFAADRIAQAFVMTGIRGTGKTTTVGKLARILVAEERTTLLATVEHRVAGIDAERPEAADEALGRRPYLGESHEPVVGDGHRQVERLGGRHRTRRVLIRTRRTACNESGSESESGNTSHHGSTTSSLSPAIGTSPKTAPWPGTGHGTRTPHTADPPNEDSPRNNCGSASARSPRSGSGSSRMPDGIRRRSQRRW